MTKIDKLKRFLIENNISFDFGERNSSSTIVAGFALHIGFYESDLEEITTTIQDNCSCDPGWKDEFERVFTFADKNNYGAWWDSRAAERTYKF